MSTQDACNQRKLFLQFNIPASRLTKQSPYDGTVTQEQLNMRRKVEILKYKTNNTSGASLSQKQEFARISRGNYNVGRVSCTADAIRPVSSRNSNIPGPEVFLYEDPNVPLYNYFKDTNIGAIGNTDNPTQWSIYIDTNVSVGQNSHGSFGTLVIRDAITQASLLYKLEIPVSYFISGNSLYTDTSGCLVNISEINPSVYVKYNGTTARTGSGSLANNNLSVRLHPTTNIFTVNSLQAYSFYATVFAGYITYADLLIFTSPGNVYTLDYSFISTNKLDILTNNVTLVNSSQTTVINGIYFGLIINETSDSSRLVESNCVLESTSTVDYNTERKFKIEDSIGNAYSNSLTATLVTYIVSVASGTNTYGTGNKYYIDGVVSPVIILQTGYNYKFDLSDSTNDTHSLRLSTTADGIHASGGTEYITNVVYNGTAGTAGAYLYISVDSTVTLPLYYFCIHHSGMGSSSPSITTTTTSTTTSSETTSESTGSSSSGY